MTAAIIGHGSVEAAAFCLNDQAIAGITAKAGGVTVWDWKTGATLRQITAAQTGSIHCLAASPDGQRLATTGPDRWIRVWDAATGRLEAAFRAHWESVRCVKFSPDGREILSGGEDGTVRLHDAATGKETLALYGHSRAVIDVAFSPDGALIAAIADDAVTRMWNRKLSNEAALLSEKLFAERKEETKQP
jgi:WD40 repeat protein